MSKSNQHNGVINRESVIGSQLLLSPGWSHYIVTAPLSPKAHVSVNKKLRQISEHSPAFNPLHQTSLQVAILDLGILPTDNESVLKQVLDKVLNRHASLKIQITRIRVSHAEQPHGTPIEGEPALLWVEVRDRLGIISSLSRDLVDGLNHLAPQITYPAPALWREDKKFNRECSIILGGVISDYKPNTYEQLFSCTGWLNDIVLQKRPSHFIPSKGYENTWRYTLPLETPPLDELESEVEFNPTPKKTRVPLKYPLTGEDLEKLTLLETHLAELSNEAPSMTKRRRSNRRKSRSSKPTVSASRSSSSS